MSKVKLNVAHPRIHPAEYFIAAEAEVNETLSLHQGG